MPQIKKNIINRKKLSSLVSKYDFSDFESSSEKINVISSWVTFVKSDAFKSSKETALQGNFLNEIFGSVLGYTNRINNSVEWNITQEQVTNIDGKFADGALGYFTSHNSLVRVVIELKDPNSNLDAKQTRYNDNRTPVEQAFSYQHKTGRECRWVIVSNFNEIRLYHSNSSTEYEVFFVNEFENIQNFKRFYYLLNSENLISKSKNSIIDNLYDESTQDEQDISKEFYTVFKKVRIDLFHHLKQHNPQIDELILIEKTQKLLDRFIFVCFCEDNFLLPDQTFKKIISVAEASFSFSENKIWNEVRGLFQAINVGSPQHNINKFNGGLFSKDDVLDGLQIKDSMLREMSKITDYDFNSDIDVNILGHIFEQSINDLEELKSQIIGQDFDKKTSKRKKDGIFYTPEYITKYIIENAIGGWLEDRKIELGFYELPELSDEDYKSISSVKGKTQSNLNILNHLQFWKYYKVQLMNIRVLDPACGSGAFLNQAFNCLYEEGQKVNEMIATLSGGQRELFGLDKHILSNNIFGVDLNNESVEITKLSLWLKTANRYSELTALDDNIKCGNSLIDDPAVAGKKAFNWFKEFPVVYPGYRDYNSKPKAVKYQHSTWDEIKGRMLQESTVEYQAFPNKDIQTESKIVNYKTADEEYNSDEWLAKEPSYSYGEGSKGYEKYGFDVIIGNPPYGAELSEEVQEYFKKKFNIGSTDTAILFIKKSMQLMNQDGQLGFIIPKSFAFASNYSKIRDYVFRNLKIMIDCKKVWKEVLLEQVIIILNKKYNQNYVSGIRKDSNINILAEIDKETTKKFGFFLNGVSNNEINIATKILEHSIFLNDIADNLPGIPHQKYINQELGEYIMVGGAEINRFGIYDYKGKIDKKWVEGYPNSFILPNSLLVQRIIAHIENPIEHILITACLPNNNEIGTITLANTINQIVIKNEYLSIFELKMLWIILNSKFVNWFTYRFILGKAIRTMQFYNPTTSRIPIPQNIIFNPKIQLPFIELADIILEKNRDFQEIRKKFLKFVVAKFNIDTASTKLQNWHELTFNAFISELKKSKVTISLQEEMAWQNLFEHNKIEALEIKNIIDSTDRKIDMLVYELYGLTEDEVKVVEGEV